jgi:hypothetical protein
VSDCACKETNEQGTSTVGETVPREYKKVSLNVWVDENEIERTVSALDHYMNGILMKEGIDIRGKTVTRG